MTGRAGLQIIYDAYGIPTSTGDASRHAFGAGWVTARDRGLLLQIGRGARVAVADVPNIDAFSLVTSIQIFTRAPRPALVTQQVQP